MLQTKLKEITPEWQAPRAIKAPKLHPIARNSECGLCRMTFTTKQLTQDTIPPPSSLGKVAHPEDKGDLGVLF
jgi:hypothetical protein